MAIPSPEPVPEGLEIPPLPKYIETASISQAKIMRCCPSVCQGLWISETRKPGKEERGKDYLFKHRILGLEEFLSFYLTA